MSGKETESTEAFALNDGKVSDKTVKIGESLLKAILRWKETVGSNSFNIKPKEGTVKAEEKGEYNVSYDLGYNVCGEKTTLRIRDVVPCLSGITLGITGVYDVSSPSTQVIPGGTLTFCDNTYTVTIGLATLYTTGSSGFGYFNSTLTNGNVVTGSFSAFNLSSTTQTLIFGPPPVFFAGQAVVTTISANICFSGFVTGSVNGLVSGTGTLLITTAVVTLTGIYVNVPKPIGPVTIPIGPFTIGGGYSLTIPQGLLDAPVNLPFNHVTTEAPSVVLVKNDKKVLSSTELSSVVIPKEVIYTSLLYSLGTVTNSLLGANLFGIVNYILSNSAIGIIPSVTVYPVPANLNIPTLYGIIDKSSVSFNDIYKLDKHDEIRLLYDDKINKSKEQCNQLLGFPLDLNLLLNGTAFSGFKL